MESNILCSIFNFCFSKFLCLSEHKNQVIFGVPCSTKKNAKGACALRILDLLVTTNEINCLGQNGKKSQPNKQNFKIKKEDQSFTEDVDYDVEFKTINPIPENCKDITTAHAIRDRAFNLYNQNLLSEVKISFSTQIYLETSGNPISLLSSHCTQAQQPEYFYFVLPNEPSKT